MAETLTSAAGLLLFGLGWLGGRLCLPLLLGMIRRAGLVRPNWQGRPTPVAAGIIFIPFAGFLSLPALLFRWAEPALVLVFLYALTAMGFWGLVDDCLGSRESGGFGGHFGRLCQGELTTGALKALGGGLMALTVVLFLTAAGGGPGRGAGAALGQTLLPALTGALLLALTTNALNLLDLRPGRTLKAFLLGMLLLLFLWPEAAREGWWFYLPFLGVTLAYLPWDLRAQAMLGDTGANILGVVLGVAFLRALSWSGQLLLLFLLILFHLLTERYSLTALIEKNPILNFLDRLGRS